ncbi:MAG: hypothetical protein RSA04_06015, partial [Clostridiales bacterium]
EAQASLNKYIGVTVTYNFTEGKEVLNGATINNWLKIDENFNTNIKNLYCLGDSSGWTRGLMMASVMGVHMARNLV